MAQWAVGLAAFGFRASSGQMIFAVERRRDAERSVEIIRTDEDGINAGHAEDFVNVRHGFRGLGHHHDEDFVVGPREAFPGVSQFAFAATRLLALHLVNAVPIRGRVLRECPATVSHDPARLIVRDQREEPLMRS